MPAHEKSARAVEHGAPPNGSPVASADNFGLPSWIFPAIRTLLLPFATILCVGVWWETGFSWEAEPAPWYCLPLFLMSIGMMIATPASLIWTIIAFIRWWRANKKQRQA
jgi:hypothetical protein